MKKSTWWITGTIVVLIIIVFSISDKSKTLTNDEPIKIGVILPISGSLDSYGEFGTRGLVMAVDRINGSGGINGSPIELIIEDSQGIPRVGLTAAQKLINQDLVKIIIGDIASSVTLGFAPLAEENQIIVIAPGSAVPSLSESGDFIFRTKLNSDVDSVELANLAFNNFNYRKIFIVNINNDYGVGIRDKFQESFESLGGEVTQTESFLPESTDLRSILTKVKGSDIDAVLLASHASETGIFLKQAKELGIDKPVFSHRGSIGPETFTIAGPAANGLLFLEEYDVTSVSKEVQGFIEEYMDKYNEEPGLFSVISYDSLMITAEAMRECGENTPCIRDYLYNLKDYGGASGKIQFDKNGDVIKNLKLMVIVDGEFVSY